MGSAMRQKMETNLILEKDLGQEAMTRKENTVVPNVGYGASKPSSPTMDANAATGSLASLIHTGATTRKGIPLNVATK